MPLWRQRLRRLRLDSSSSSKASFLSDGPRVLPAPLQYRRTNPAAVPDLRLHFVTPRLLPPPLTELLKLLRDPATSSPFPPLLFAAGSSSLLAETYVSSHPLSALCLVSPVPAPSAHERDPPAYPTALDEFDYEPGFPIAILSPDGSPDAGRKSFAASPSHRLLRDFADEHDEGLVRALSGGLDERGWEQVMDWMDENGL